MCGSTRESYRNFESEYGLTIIRLNYYGVFLLNVKVFFFAKFQFKNALENAKMH